LNSLFRIKHADFTIRFQPTALSLALWVDPTYRSVDHDFFRGYLRPGDVAVDVGANIGSLTLTASSSVGTSGTVVSVEADPRTAAFLSRNCAANRARNVQIIPCAVGSSPGAVLLSRQSDDSTTFVSNDGGDVTVPMRTLDEVLAGVPGRIALVKIDVEGYELAVLVGASKTLARADCVYFEAWDFLCARYGYAVTDIVQLLGAAGFGVYRLGPGGTITPVPSTFSASMLENLVAIRDVDAYCARTSSSVAG